MNIALTGGGTAGHIMPNIALLEDLNNSFDKIYYFGQPNSMEEKLLKDKNVEFIPIKAVKFNRQNLFSNIKIPFLIPNCIFSAYKQLKRLNVDVAFAKGGYISLPLIFAAKLLRIPIICHESDSTLGLANKVALPITNLLITSYKDTSKNKKSVFIGNPLRKEIFSGDSNYIKYKYNINNNLPILLIVGGSLGAQAINELIYNSLDVLANYYNIVHITGLNYEKINKPNYYQETFINNIQDYIASADIIISRCGANMSGELTALNKKVLYVPLSNKASRGDQIDNARKLEENNYAKVLNEEDLNIGNLMNALEEVRFMQKNKYYYDTQIPTKIVNLIKNVALSKK